jgi:hypothetical protein
VRPLACHRSWPPTLPAAAPRRSALLILLAALLTPSCTRSPFSEPAARAHVQVLAGEIGSRPVGSAANARARSYIVSRLASLGFEVTVGDREARRPELGLSARVRNIVAIRPGRRREAIALVSHYDSAPNSPGAADAALGVAVSLEVARILAPRTLNHSIAVLITDAEEIGLMGASALVEDRALMSRIAAYVNLEAIGSAGPSLLFEAGPGPGLPRLWGRAARAPYGTSLATEIYRLLPNDTDFTILSRQGIPGLNFAPIGDSYPYHTARDRPDRLSAETIAQTGANALAFVEALDSSGSAAPGTAEATFFDLGRWVGVAYGPAGRLALTIAATLAGAAAAIRMLVQSWRALGPGAVMLSTTLAVVGFLLVAGTGVAGTWLIRVLRPELHPWYGHPERLYGFLLASQALAIWIAARLARRVCRYFGRPFERAGIWISTIAVWIALALATDARLPAASYLWSLPLVAAGVLLLVTPRRREAESAVDALTFAGTALLWVGLGRDLALFLVPVFGRLSIVTPTYVFGAWMATVAAMVLPPFMALLTGATIAPRLQSSRTGALLAAVSVLLAGWAYGAPAYTTERPLRRQVRYVQDGASGRAAWEVGGNEPSLDLPGSPSDLRWGPQPPEPGPGTALAPLRHPFVFRAATTPGAPVPGTVSVALAGGAGSVELEVVARPSTPDARVDFVLPTGLTPLESSLPGRTGRDGRWRAGFVAAPAAGVTFRASFPPGEASRVRQAAVVFIATTLPGGTGWQGLPGWLPQERAVWTSSAAYVVPLFPAVAPGAGLP